MSIPFRLLFFLLTLVIVFHLGILFHFIPYDIAWGGRLQNDREMYVFELFSLFVNLFLVAVLLIKAGKWKSSLNPKVVNGILWAFFGMFLLNTVGNLLAVTTFEKGFSVITSLMAVLLWKVLKGEGSTNTPN